MLTFKKAKAEDLDEFFNLMRQETSDYLKDSLWKIGLTESAFQAKFKSVGQIYIICVGNEYAGFYWVEKREDILHLHGIVIRKEFQGRGYGRRVMEALECRHGHGISSIELGVYHFNHTARRLYDSLGYQLIEQLNDVQFDIMRKAMPGAGDLTTQG